MFNEFDTVVIRELRLSTRPVIGTGGIERQPCVGDQGSIVHVLGPWNYTVESVDGAGRTVWLAEFRADELVAPSQDWEFSAEEVFPGLYRATGTGPGGLRAEVTDTDASAQSPPVELSLRGISADCEARG